MENSIIRLLEIFIVVIVFIGIAVEIISSVKITSDEYNISEYKDCVSQTQNQDYCFNKFIERK